MSALFLLTLGEIPYTASNSFEDNYQFIIEEYPEYLPLLEKEFLINSPTFTMYYDYGDELIKTTYALNGKITPRQLLESISNFYQHELTEDEVAYLQSKGFNVQVGESVGLFLGDHVYLEGLFPHEDGYRLNLGS